MILAIEVCLMILSGGALFIFAPQMMQIFSDDKLVISLGTSVLRMVAISEPFYGVSIIIEGMLQGMGKTMVPLICNIIGMWGVRITSTYVCTQILGFGLISVWGCMIAHNMLLFCIYLVIYFRGSWNPLRNMPESESA